MNSDLFSPTKLKELTAEFGFSPSKKYGQNYLLNKSVIEKMIIAADIGPKDTVVEVGPGFGTLTFALAQKAGHVRAYEIEKKLQSYWNEQVLAHKNIEIVWGNVLYQLSDEQGENASVAKSLALPEKYKLVANLPYQITSRLFRVFLESHNPPTTMVVMVQKEVADRIVARPGDMSLLSVSVQYFGRPKIITKVSKGNFWPAPKVDSAVIGITEIAARPDSKAFFNMVRAGFANKRKQLWHNLSNGLGIPKEQAQLAVKNVMHNTTARAQELSVWEWEALADEIR